MATVYSLVCWGGRTGKSVAASNSSGLILTLTNHGLRDGTGIVFSGTSAPGNVTFGTTYYAKSLSANTFGIYTEAALTNRVAWSSAGSGVVAKSNKMIDYLAAPPTSERWGAAGSERCYDGLVSWNTARTAAASALDTEVCEIGEAFYDIVPNVSYYVDLTVAAGACLVTTNVAGVRSAGWHNGVIGAGYVLQYKTNNGLRLTKYNTTLNGFHVCEDTTSANYAVSATVPTCIVGQMILLGRGIGVTASSSAGVIFGIPITVTNSLILGWSNGVVTVDYAKNPRLYNCTITKNAYGIRGQYGSTKNMYGFYYNNIVVGNTTNWFAMPATVEGADRNAALAGEAWAQAGGTAITVATTDFADFANNDFRPAFSSSPQVDAGVEYFGISKVDIGDAERPNYNNGGAEAFDVGCYEFDHGFGPHPITATLTLTGLSSGTDVVVRAAGTGTILDSVDSTSGNWTYTYGAAHNVDIDVIKPGMVLVTFRNLALTATSSSIPVSQQFDRNYQ